MEDTTQARRQVLHTIRELADAGLTVEGDGQIQVICILTEIVKYIGLCPEVPLIGFEAPALQRLATRWFEWIERPRGRKRETHELH